MLDTMVQCALVATHWWQPKGLYTNISQEAKEDFEAVLCADLPTGGEGGHQGPTLALHRLNCCHLGDR